MTELQADWLIYGAYGFTARRIAAEAYRRGMRPALGGRDGARLSELSRQLGASSRCFSLESSEAIAREIEGFRLILNCAGPFSRTAPALVDACLRAGVSYLDITGEIDVIEHLAQRHEQAMARGVCLIPAVGFDVVPTDALACLLKEALPDAQFLQLAFTGTGSISPGTAATMIEALPKGACVRREGKLQWVPLVWKTRRIAFDSGTRWAALIPWGDVASAWYSTAIPNIEVYLAMSRSAIFVLRYTRRLLPSLLTRLGPARSQRLIRNFLRIPPAGQLEAGISGVATGSGSAKTVDIWGSVREARGKAISATMQTPDGYVLTVQSALNAVERLLTAHPSGGFFTPTQAFGKDFALALDGVHFRLKDGNNANSSEAP